MLNVNSEGLPPRIEVKEVKPYVVTALSNQLEAAVPAKKLNKSTVFKSNRPRKLACQFVAMGDTDKHCI